MVPDLKVPDGVRSGSGYLMVPDLRVPDGAQSQVIGWCPISGYLMVTSLRVPYSARSEGTCMIVPGRWVPLLVPDRREPDGA